MFSRKTSSHKKISAGRRLWPAFTDWFADKYSRFHCQYPKTRLAFYTAFVGSPGAMLAYMNVRLKVALPFQGRLQNFFQEHDLLLLAAMVWPLLGVFIAVLIAEYLKRVAVNDGNEVGELVALLTALDDVEGKKMNRFAEFAKKVQSDMAIANDAFQQITMPDLQMDYLIISLHHYLSKTMGDKSLQITLAKIESDKPSGKPIRTPNEQLLPDHLFGEDAGRTMFASTARSRKTQVIEDIGAFLLKKKKPSGVSYLPTSDEDKGSILCKPLVSPYLGRVLYVLSFYSETTGMLTERFEKKHRLAMKSFCNRLLLEAHLEEIKARAGGKDAKPELGLRAARDDEARTGQGL